MTLMNAQPPDEEDVYTIDDSDEEFSTASEASFAASTRVAIEHKTVNVYRNGLLYETKRF